MLGVEREGEDGCEAGVVLPRLVPLAEDHAHRDREAAHGFCRRFAGRLRCLGPTGEETGDGHGLVALEDVLGQRVRSCRLGVEQGDLRCRLGVVPAQDDGGRGGQQFPVHGVSADRRSESGRADESAARRVTEAPLRSGEWGGHRTARFTRGAMPTCPGRGTAGEEPGQVAQCRPGQAVTGGDQHQIGDVVRMPYERDAQPRTGGGAQRPAGFLFRAPLRGRCRRALPGAPLPQHAFGGLANLFQPSP